MCTSINAIRIAILAPTIMTTETESALRPLCPFRRIGHGGDDQRPSASRRMFLQTAASLAGAALVASADSVPAAADEPPVARIAITLDLEMSAQYPRRDLTEWNYEKGNLDEATKRLRSALDADPGFRRRRMFSWWRTKISRASAAASTAAG